MLLWASPAHPAKSWKPRFKPKPGTVQYFAVASELVMSADLGLLGRQRVKANLVIDLQQRIVERRRRGPTTLELTLERIRIDFESDQRSVQYDSAEPEAGDDEPARDYLDRLIGQTVTLVVSRRGEVIDARGLEGLWDDLDRSKETDSERGPGALLETLTQGLGLEVIGALYQQASPVFPEGRVRSGDTWTAEETIPDLAFGVMRIDSDYEVSGAGKLKRHRYVKTAVRNRIELEGRGPLVERIGVLAGAEGEVQVTTERAEGSGTIWTERKTGVTLGFVATQQMKLFLSVPLRVLGLSKRLKIPVSLEQQIRFERME